jgi:hypothetical protein
MLHGLIAWLISRVPSYLRRAVNSTTRFQLASLSAEASPRHRKAFGVIW